MQNLYYMQKYIVEGIWKYFSLSLDPLILSIFMLTFLLAPFRIG